MRGHLKENANCPARETGRGEWLTVKEYAESRGYHVQTVYSAIRRNLFPYRVERLGRGIRIDVSRESIEQRKAS